MAVKKSEPNQQVSAIVPTYKNEFPSMIKQKYTPNEINLLFGLIGVLKNQETRSDTFDFDTVKLLAGLDLDSRPSRVISFLNNFLSPEKNYIEYEKETENGSVTAYREYIFTVVGINRQDKFIELSFADGDMIQYLFNNFEKGNFTKIDFSVLHGLSLNIHKKLYLAIAQYSSLGHRNFKMDELRETIAGDTSKQLTNLQFFNKYINPGVKAINEASNGSIYVTVEKVMPTTAGRNLTNVIFTIESRNEIKSVTETTLTKLAVDDMKNDEAEQDLLDLLKNNY